MNASTETFEPAASSVAIAKLPDRWTAGDQEIKLTFTRATQFLRKAGKNRPQFQTEARTGTKLWIWEAFLAFLCGIEWGARNREALNLAAQKSLKEVVGSEFGNPYAGFEEKDDDWILIKP